MLLSLHRPLYGCKADLPAQRVKLRHRGMFTLRLGGRSALLSNFATSNDGVWIRAHCGLGMSLNIRAR